MTKISRLKQWILIGIPLAGVMALLVWGGLALAKALNWEQRANAQLEAEIEHFNAETSRASPVLGFLFCNYEDSDDDKTFERNINACKQFLQAGPHADTSGGLSDAKAYYYLGRGYAKQHKWDLTIAAFKKTLTLLPNAPGVYNELGNAYEQYQKPDQAIAAYRKSLALDPKSNTPLLNLGSLYLHQDKTDLALETFHQALKIDPEDQDVYASIGLAYKKQGTIDPAITAYEKSIETGKRSAVGVKFPLNYYNLASLYQQKGNYEKALNNFEAAKTLWPMKVFDDIDDKIDQCREALGEPTLAEEAKARACADQAETLDVLNECMQVYAKKGNRGH